ncbi:MAG: helix-turn-helix domain-containing protein [Acutalibacteraceae bacterium]
MQYQDTISESIAFIKAHIEENLTAEQIAAHAGYSLFHFCRMFALETDVPLMQYVRQLRLAHARSALDGTQKVLDVALRYGFESASGFSKSFRKAFGYSPTAYTVRTRGVDTGFLLDIAEVIEPPRLLHRAAFRVAGYGMTTDLADGFTKDVAAYWDTYNGEQLESKMYEILQPPRHGEVGLCMPGAGGKAVYLFGVIVEDFSRVQPDMTAAEIPAADYAVFTTPPVNNTATAATYDKDPLSIAVKETWRYIFTQGLRKNGCRLDEEKFAFEFYDERCHGLENAIAEIYIPIKES